MQELLSGPGRLCTGLGITVADSGTDLLGGGDLRLFRRAPRRRLIAATPRIGIDYAGESQLVGYPSQFPSVSMVDWETGAPNARFRVLELLKKHFTPGDQIIRTGTGFMGSSPMYHAQAFQSPRGGRKLLLINKRARSLDLSLAGFAGAIAEVVDQSSGGAPARSERLGGEALRLPGFAVAVLTLP